MSENNPQPKSSEGGEAKSLPRVPEASELPVTLKRSRLSRFLIILGMVVLIYLVGYAPMKWQVRQLARERQTIRTDLRRGRLQLTLASTAVDARRGEYELARKEAAEFFTNLSNELREVNPVFETEQRASLEKLLEQRDELITLLARSDPASAERLANLYVSYREVMERQTAAVRQ